MDRLFSRRNQDVFAQHYTKLVDHSFGENLNNGEGGEDDDDDDGEILSLKRVNHELNDVPVSIGPATKKQLRKKKIQQYPQGSKLKFDDEGNPHSLYEFQSERDFRQSGPTEELISQHLATGAEKLKEVDVMDRLVAKQKKKEKKVKKEQH